MVGAGKRKTRLPRKILRVILSDGSCQLQPQLNEYKTIKEEQIYEEGNSPIYYKTEEQKIYQENFLKSENIYRKSPPHSNGFHENGYHHIEYRKRSPRPYIDSENHYYGPESPHIYPSAFRKDDYRSQPVPREVSPILRKPKEETGGKKSPPKQDLTTRASYKHQHPEPTPEFPYQCETCDMLFKTMELLVDHQTAVHDNNRQFACRYCSKRFNDKYNMRKHVLIHVGEKRHKCQFCEKAFLRKDHLRSHLQTHYNRKFGCKICGKGYRTMELYQRHVKTHKDDSYMSMMNNGEILQPDICSITEENLQRKSDATSNPKENTVQHEDDVPVTILDEDFNMASPWNEGSPSVSENDISMVDSPLHSEHSPRDASQQNGLDHDHQKGYSCHKCKLTFNDMHSLQGHQQNCDTTPVKKNPSWQCMKCNIVFDEPSTLKQHYEKVHSIDKPIQSPSRWRCKTCDINYPNSKELSRHYAHAHKDAQIFPCSECSKTFTVWHNLKKHMLIHLGDKKHKCSICDKGFVRKDHLNSHMKVHLGEGSKFTCPICNKVFRLKQMYFKHMNLHGLEQAYTVVDKKVAIEGNR